MGLMLLVVVSSVINLKPCYAYPQVDEHLYKRVHLPRHQADLGSRLCVTMVGSLRSMPPIGEVNNSWGG